MKMVVSLDSDNSDLKEIKSAAINSEFGLQSEILLPDERRDAAFIDMRGCRIYSYTKAKEIGIHTGLTPSKIHGILKQPEGVFILDAAFEEAGIDPEEAGVCFKDYYVQPRVYRYLEEWTSELDKQYRLIFSFSVRIKELQATMEVASEMGDGELSSDTRDSLDQMRATLTHKCYQFRFESKDIPGGSAISRISGKNGVVRRFINGRRVDFSGRSAIIPDFTLKYDEIGIPMPMVYELHKPHIMKLLQRRGFYKTHRQALGAWKRRESAALDIMDELAENAYILLNRAPTLHRYGIQLFTKVRIDWESKALKIPPLVCEPIGGDFDGDTVSVGLILTKQAKEEALELMAMEKNMLSSANGMPMFKPSHESILGLYLGDRGLISGICDIPEGELPSPLDGNGVGELVKQIISTHGQSRKSMTAIHDLTIYGAERSTKAGCSLGMDDFKTDATNYQDWMNTTTEENGLKLLAVSGARVKDVQVGAMCYGRGDLMVPDGFVECKGNLRDSLDQNDYIMTARAGRMALSSNVEVVPDSGHLFFQLGNFLQNIIVEDPADWGIDPSTGFPYDVGTRIGIITAQSISERLTQVSLSQKHKSGAGDSTGIMDKKNSIIAQFKRFLGTEEEFLTLEDMNQYYDEVFYPKFHELSPGLADIHALVLWRGLTSVEELTLRTMSRTLTKHSESFLGAIRYGYVKRAINDVIENGTIEDQLTISDVTRLGQIPDLIQSKRTVAKTEVVAEIVNEEPELSEIDLELIALLADQKFSDEPSHH